MLDIVAICMAIAIATAMMVMLLAAMRMMMVMMHPGLACDSRMAHDTRMSVARRCVVSFPCVTRMRVAHKCAIRFATRARPSATCRAIRVCVRHTMLVASACTMRFVYVYVSLPDVVSYASRMTHLESYQVCYRMWVTPMLPYALRMTR